MSTSKQSYPTFRTSAAAIAANGYSIVPLKPNEKRPIPDGWQNYEYQPGDERMFPARAGIGLLTRTQPASDNDCKVPEIADEINKVIEEELGPAPVRVGEAPKTLRIYTIDGEPFKKKQTGVYRLEGDAPDFKGHKFEFLGDGEQAVAYGIHPDTKKPYVWDGLGNPLTTPVGLLPTVNERQAEALKNKVETILRKHGTLTTVGNKKKGDTQAAASGAQGFVIGGGRNEYLSREAFRLRKQGSTVEQLFDVLRALNSARCRPPLADPELWDIAKGKRKVLPDAVSTADFRAYMPMHQYIFVPTGQLWPGSSVNSRIPPIPNRDGDPTPASIWLDQYQAVEQMTWAPGEPAVVEGRLVSNGGWVERAGCATFNLYRPPNAVMGNASEATRWVDHVRLVYPEHAEHIMKWLAHRVQRPGQKINHALVLSGKPGIGKDSILEPVKYAVGAWNFADVSPIQLLGRFNGFVKSVVLRISEARDLGDVDRYAFYDHTKVYTAAPPDVIRCDEKNLREHDVVNVCGVIITSNYKTDGIYLPADDRRHYVTWSPRSVQDFAPKYFRDLYKWFGGGGNEHVTAYLHSVDLTGFDPKEPPPKTAEFWDIVDANRAPEDAELADLVDAMGKPNAITLQMLMAKAESRSSSFSVGIGDWLKDRKNRRAIPHRLESVGYVAVRNEAVGDGQWAIEGKRQSVYALDTLSVRDRISAATKLCSK